MTTPSPHLRSYPIGSIPGASYRRSPDFAALAAALRAQSRDLMERYRIRYEHARAAALPKAMREQG